MLNGKYPLLLIEMNLIPIPIYIDENVFKIALKNEDKAVTMNTTKTGQFTNQMIDQNTLQLTFTVAKESQYGVIVISLLDKLYTIIGNLYKKYKKTDGATDSLMSKVQNWLSGINYTVSYYSETESIDNAYISSFTKVTAAGSSETTINLTLEKKAPETPEEKALDTRMDLSGYSTKIGTREITKGA